MSDFPLWKRCRVLACPGRLRMLYVLRGSAWQHVKAIAVQLGLTEDVASKNLQLLASAGFLKFERDGKYLFYGLDDQDPLLQLVLVELEASEEDMSLIMSMLTALTHERRVGIISVLKAEPDNMIGLCRRLHLSKRACVRHIDKLVRRGWVSLDDETCSLLKPDSRFGRALLQFTEQDGTLAQVCRTGG